MYLYSEFIKWGQEIRLLSSALKATCFLYIYLTKLISKYKSTGINLFEQ